MINQDIANCFKQTFSECCFDSYNDNENVSELFRKMSYFNDDRPIWEYILNLVIPC